MNLLAIDPGADEIGYARFRLDRYEIGMTSQRVVGECLSELGAVHLPYPEMDRTLAERLRALWGVFQAKVIQPVDLATVIVIEENAGRALYARHAKLDKDRGDPTKRDESGLTPAQIALIKSLRLQWLMAGVIFGCLHQIGYPVRFEQPGNMKKNEKRPLAELFLKGSRFEAPPKPRRRWSQDEADALLLGLAALPRIAARLRQLPRSVAQEHPGELAPANQPPAFPL